MRNKNSIWCGMLSIEQIITKALECVWQRSKRAKKE